MLMPQQIADAVLDPMAMGSMPIQLTASSLIVWLIDWLKRSERFPWISNETERLNQAAAVIGAALTSAGIQFGLEASSVAGTYSLVITGLSMAALAHFVSGFLVSLVGQQSILKVYQAVNLLRAISAKLPELK